MVAIVENAPARRGLFGWLRDSLPTFGMIVGLGGVAAWGVTSDWHFGLGASATVEPEARTAEAAIGSAAAPDLATLTFPSPEAAERAGIEVAPAWPEAMVDAVAANGEIGFAPDRITRLSARCAGTLSQILKAPGDRVAANELLAVIESPDVASAKAELLQGLLQQRQRQAALTKLLELPRPATAPQRLQAELALRDASARVRAAEQALASLGLPVNTAAADFAPLELAEVAAKLRTLGLPDGMAVSSSACLPVRAPFAGVILGSSGSAGETVAQGSPLFTVVDPSQLWLTLQLDPADARKIAVGQTVRFMPDGSTRECEGAIGWIGSLIDPVLRTIAVRAILDNPTGELRASTLGRGRVIVRTAPAALAVPAEAVQTVRGTSVVFLRDPTFLREGGNCAFYARPVRAGIRTSQRVEIADGLKQGDIVAVLGAAALANQLERTPAGK